MMTEIELRRFWAKVDLGGRDECWLWKGAQSRGYGQLSVGGKATYVHRISWRLVNGAIPDGMVMDHLCRTRLCVNPRHLEPVTNRENVLRGESFAAKNARKSTCKFGHQLGQPQALSSGRTGRECVVCKRRADMMLKRIYRAQAKALESKEKQP